MGSRPGGHPQHFHETLMKQNKLRAILALGHVLAAMACSPTRAEPPEPSPAPTDTPAQPLPPPTPFVGVEELWGNEQMGPWRNGRFLVWRGLLWEGHFPEGVPALPEKELLVVGDSLVSGMPRARQGQGSPRSSSSWMSAPGSGRGPMWSSGPHWCNGGPTATTWASSPIPARPMRSSTPSIRASTCASPRRQLHYAGQHPGANLPTRWPADARPVRAPQLPQRALPEEVRFLRLLPHVPGRGGLRHRAGVAPSASRPCTPSTASRAGSAATPACCGPSSSRRPVGRDCYCPRARACCHS